MDISIELFDQLMYVANKKILSMYPFVLMDKNDLSVYLKLVMISNDFDLNYDMSIDPNDLIVDEE